MKKGLTYAKKLNPFLNTFIVSETLPFKFYNFLF